MEKLNIAEILKDCPKGMELDCALFENLEFDHIAKDNRPYPIICRVKAEWGGYHLHTFTEYGYYSAEKYSKCVIYPKGKTTWEGFQRPFKDGDVVAVTMIPEGIWVGIFKQYKAMFFESYCSLNTIGEFRNTGFTDHSLIGIRFATEEEKQKLFDAIKANGYKWNAETKTLQKLITLKFKVGDMIRAKGTNYGVKILGIKWDKTETYYETSLYEISVKDQDIYELATNKFDINTLIPFESRVLVRDSKSQKWYPAIWGVKTDYIDYPYIVVGGNSYRQCIPYGQNKHLLGTTDNCNDYYRTWE